MIEQILSYLMPILSLIIALVFYAMVHDDFRFESDAEKAAALLCLIAFSIIFYQIFMLVAILIGLVFIFTYVGAKIYALYCKSKHASVGFNQTRIRRNAYTPHINQRVMVREPQQNVLESDGVDVSDLSLEMDLTEE